MAASRSTVRNRPREASRTPLTGHLDLVCGLDDRVRSSLRSQSFSAPFHVSKPHFDEKTLVVNIVNPTAGLFSCDRLSCRVSVERGASLLLTSPSSSRVHRATSEPACVTQQFYVASGGFLDVWPELFIPQSGARYRQKTEIHLEETAELLYFEAIAPGRVASGEQFAFASLAWSTDAFLGDDHIFRERYRLASGSESSAALLASFAAPYYASCLSISPHLRAGADFLAEIHALHHPAAWVGCSRLRSHAWAIRIVAEGSIALREKLNAVRAILYRALLRKQPNLRRTSPIA